MSSVVVRIFFYILHFSAKNNNLSSVFANRKHKSDFAISVPEHTHFTSKQTSFFSQSLFSTHTIPVSLPDSRGFSRLGSTT
mmetsp:Transcript_25699/g.54286  ORF Transcript_25699/g.54286 Transcript_25699/m.54286 type:complete len:81 (+) Transcript_25699:169-411(+)